MIPKGFPWTRSEEPWFPYWNQFILKEIKGLLKETVGFLTENNIPLEKNAMLSMEVSGFHMEINWPLKRTNVFLEEIILRSSQGSPWIPSGSEWIHRWKQCVP